MPTAVLSTAQADLASIGTFIWDEIKAGWVWITGEARMIGHALVGLIQPLLAPFGATIGQDLIGAATAFMGKIAASLAGGAWPALADLETAFLNVLGTLTGNLLAAAQSLLSNAVQAVLGGLQLQVTKA